MRRSIRSLVAASAVAGALVVTGVVGASPASAISITLDSVTPNSGSTLGGDLVHVHGTNIGRVGALILFGGNLSVVVSVDGFDDMTVVTPPGQTGSVDVTAVIVTSGSLYTLQGRPSPLTIYGGFTYVNPLPSSWFQSIGRASATTSCPPGWNPSWAEWMNDHTGGYVCNREQYWSTSLADWNYRLRHSTN